MNTKHTPGPWAGGIATDKDGQIILLWQDSPGRRTIEPTNDNAAFIVRACNSHDDLVAALGRILAAHDSNNNGAVAGEAKLCAQFADIARAALAKAKGE